MSANLGSNGMRTKTNALGRVSSIKLMPVTKDAHGELSALSAGSEFTKHFEGNLRKVRVLRGEHGAQGRGRRGVADEAERACGLTAHVRRRALVRQRLDERGHGVTASNLS